MNLANIRNTTVVLVVFCYMLFNYGFQVIRIPPNSGPPVGEMLLLISLPFIDYSVLINRVRRNGLFILLVAWWCVGVGHLSTDIINYGFWAIRDASHIIETLFIFLGILLPREKIISFVKRYKRYSIIIVLYALTYIFKDYLYTLLPVIDTSAGGSTYLISYITTPSLLLLVAFSLFIPGAQTRGNEWTTYALFGLIVVYVMVVFQARTPFLQILALSIFLTKISPSSGLRLLGASIVFIVIMLIYSVSGVELPSRLGLSYNIDVMFHHIEAMFGSRSAGLEDAAEGVSMRLFWWQQIWDQLTQSASSLIFGLGYGKPLIDFQLAGDIIVREPHNSIISALARTGAIGMILLLAFWIGLVSAWVCVYSRAVQEKDVGTTRFLIICMMFFILTWVTSIGEDAFEKPFWAIPFYFFWGTVLRTKFDYDQKHALNSKLESL